MATLTDIDSTADWLPVLLQTSDPLFPTGAYAHSFGLEEVVRLGLVSSEADLLGFLELQVLPMLRNVELPYLRFAYDAARAGNGRGLGELSREIGAWKMNRETREASLQIGERRLEIARKIFGQGALEEFARGDAPRHHIVVYGLQMAARGVPLGATLLAYFYQAIAALGSAALKLIRIGQEGVQRVLHRCLREAKTVVECSLAVERADAGVFNPVLEIAAMRHEFADERLFIS